MCRCDKAFDFFRPMLTIGIENDDELQSAIEPVSQARS